MHRQASVGVDMEEVPVRPQFKGVYLAQVVDVSPADHAVQVVFMNMSGVLSYQTNRPLKVKVLQRRAGLQGAILELPQRGEWGLVCFPDGSDQLAVWLGALNRDMSNLAFDGIGPTTLLEQHESGVYRLIDDAGNVDMVFADGSYVRVGTGIATTARQHHERQGQERRTVPFINPVTAPTTMFVRHASGTTVQIGPDGTVTVSGAAAITIQGAGITTVEGGGADKTVLGGPAGADYVVLLAGLLNIITWLTTHTHTGVQGGPDTSGPPPSPPLPPVAGTDYTVNARAS